MIVTISLLAALAASVVAGVLASALRSQQRAHERERSRLVDQVCHLADKPWALPPRDLAEPLPAESVYDDDGLIEV